MGGDVQESDPERSKYNILNKNSFLFVDFKDTYARGNIY